MAEKVKKPFDIGLVMTRVEAAVEPHPQAALFELASKGFNTPFQQLVACIISIRTRDEVTLPTAQDLLSKTPTAKQVAALSVEVIDDLIAKSTFHERKAQQIQTAAQQIVKKYGGELPCKREVLLGFTGVGPKCANLVLGVACGQPYISVDIHVHRVTNRWGYVQGSSPKQTLKRLKEKLPRRYWLDINRWLVPFGKHICQGQKPKCSTCPVLNMCQQVGVTKHR